MRSGSLEAPYRFAATNALSVPLRRGLKTQISIPEAPIPKACFHPSNGAI